jgi:hypothetical protein
MSVVSHLLYGTLRLRAYDLLPTPPPPPPPPPPQQQQQQQAGASNGDGGLSLGQAVAALRQRMQQGLQSISSGSMLGEGEDGEEEAGKYALGQLLRARCQQEQDVTAPAASPLVLYPDSELVDWLV